MVVISHGPIFIHPYEPVRVKKTGGAPVEHTVIALFIIPQIPIQLFTLIFWSWKLVKVYVSNWVHQIIDLIYIYI